VNAQNIGQIHSAITFVYIIKTKRPSKTRFLFCVVKVTPKVTTPLSVFFLEDRFNKQVSLNVKISPTRADVG
jgi:hypothetical protein